MSVESINPKSNDTLANRAKGMARQVLNLVNQALFDGAKENAAFSVILESQESNQAPLVDKPKQQELNETNFQEESNIPLNAEKPEKTETSKAPKTEKSEKLDRDQTADLSLEAEIVSEVNASESQGNQLNSEVPVVSQDVNNAEIDPLSSPVSDSTLVQTELAASATISQAQSKVEKEAVQLVADEQQVTDTVQPEQLATATTGNQDNPKIPEEIAEKIKQFKPQEQRQAHATKNDDNIGQNVKEFVQNQNEIRKEEAVNFGRNSDNFQANKIAQDKTQLAANLQQFISQSSTKDVLLSNAILAEQLKTINPENISSIKTANTAIKIGTDSLTLAATKPSGISAASANSQMAAFQNPDFQDLGQKLENSKNSKPLSKSQLVSTMEKVEAVLKKIADSKDGTTISMRLDPPQLGSVRADVSLKDGVLHARLTAENAQVLQILRDRASDLQVTLRKMGLDVEKVSISVNSSDLGTFSGDAEDRQGKNGTRQGSFFSAQADFAEPTDSNILDHWIA